MEVLDFDHLDDLISASSRDQFFLWHKGKRTKQFRIFIADTEEGNTTVPEIYIQGYRDFTHEAKPLGLVRGNPL